jgi:hypothetical protein
VLGVDLVGGLVAESRVETLLIITEFDVTRNVGHGVSAGGVHCAVDAFVLEHAKERFGHGIIETDPGAPDGVSDVERFQDLSELPRHVVAAAVGMEYRAGSKVIVSRGHPDRFLDERGFVVVVHSPSDHGFGVAINDRGEINPALPRRDICLGSNRRSDRQLF